MVLVVVMLALMLVSCGYKFTNKDMTENARFKNGMTTADFKSALLKLLVEDAEFGNSDKEDQRNALVQDYIYKVLEGAVKTSDTSLQLKDGEVDYNDIVYYAYYVTYTHEVNKKDDKGNDVKDENDNVVKETVTDFLYVSKMATTTTNIKLGYSNETLKGENAKIRDAIQETIININNNFENYAYDVKGNIYDYVGDKKDIQVYVSYTKSYNVEVKADDNGTAAQDADDTTTTETKTETKTETVKYSLVTLNPDSTDFLIKSLLTTETKDGVTTGKYSFNTKIDKLVDDNGTKTPTGDGVTEEAKKAAEADDITYTNITVHFAPKADNIPNYVIEADYVVETEFTTDDFIGYESTKLTVAKDATLTYYVYPLNYFDVEDLTAEEILTNDSLTKELLDDSKLDELLKAVSEKKEGEDKSVLTVFNEAYTAYDKAKTDFESADEKLNGKKSDATDDGAKGDYADVLVEAVEAAIKSMKDAISAEDADAEAKKAAIDTLVGTILLNADKTVKAAILDSSKPNDTVKELCEAAKKDKSDADKTAIDDFYKGVVEGSKKSTLESKSTILGSANTTYTEKKNDLYGTKKAAQAAYDAAVAVALEAARAEDPNATDESDAVKNDENVKAAKETLDKATIGKEAEYENAKKALFAGIGDLTKTEKDENGEDKTVVDKTAEERVLEQYVESVKEMKISAYEDEMTINIGKAVWALMNDSVEVYEIPEKALEEIYDRMYEIYEFEFYDPNGTKHSSGVTMYKWYSSRGGFKQYLQDTTKTSSYDAAKAAIKAEAETYVKEIIVIHFIAEAMGLELDKSEIKEYTGNGYKAAKEQYGDLNIKAAIQFNKLFDHFLEVEMTENEKGEEEVKKDENGKKIYKNVAIGSYKEAETK